MKQLAKTMFGAYALAAIAAVFTGGAAAGDDVPYRVEDGKVDERTYVGWRFFNSTCYICHGVDATGTVVAPNLVERVKKLTPQQFANVVLSRYVVTLGSGQITGDDRTAVRQAYIDLVTKRERGELIMPAWEDDPNIKPHIMDLYAYLRARADGVLAPGRPERLDR